MKKRLTPVVIIGVIFVISFVSLISLAPGSVAASDNKAPGTPDVVGVYADDNLVNTWGDNVNITFQVYDENGIRSVKRVEIWIKNEGNGTEAYDNWPDGNIKAVQKLSAWENEYSFTYDPDNDFKIGYATAKIRAVDNEGNENTIREENLFEVTESDISAETENAENVSENSATLNATIELAGYDKVEAVFYYENEENHASWSENTGWENTRLTSYEKSITSLQPYETYWFRVGIRLPKNNYENAHQVDNGSVLKFSTYPENAEVTTEKISYETKSDFIDRKPTLNAGLSYGGHENVDIIFFYRSGGEESWENTGWDEGYSRENYSYTLSSLSKDTTYEFYPKIRFGPSSKNLIDNGSVLTFNTGAVRVRASIPPEVEVNSESDLTIEVLNEHMDKELREVTVETTDSRFSDNYVSIGTIGADSSGSATLTYQPLNSGEKTLDFSIGYSLYQDNEFLFSGTKNVSSSILVTGTEYENAIDLRVSSDNPPSQLIFNGETFTAQLEVHNQRPTEVTGIRIVGEKIRDYGVGSLSGDESTTVQIRVKPENYEVGEVNVLKLRAIHELGVSSPLELKFQVQDENAPVGVYLIRSNSPIFQGETLEFTVLVAGSEDSQAEDLRVESLSENVLPEGYWIGEEMKNLTSQQITLGQGEQGTNLEGLLGQGGGGESESDEEEKRVVVGRKLYFEAANLKPGENSLKFRITYELGNKVVRRKFKVDFRIHHTPEVSLIQAEPVEAIEGETATISLEIANPMSIKIEAVRVIPPENLLITPRPTYWIGPMDSDEFLPVEFKLQTSGLKDGENLKFYPIYRIEDKEIEGPSLTVQVDLKSPSRSPLKVYGMALVVIVFVLILAIFWFRR